MTARALASVKAVDWKREVYEQRDEGPKPARVWFVVPGSGTEELRGLRGEGGFTSEHSTSFEVELDYDFE